MTNEEILQYNKMCAEFLGKKTHKNKIVLDYKDFSGVNPNGEVWTEMKYESDWNCIMKVVEAIEGSGYQVDIQNNHCFIQKSESFGGSRVYAENKKEAVVQAINQFLIWYNNEKTSIQGRDLNANEG